MNKKKEDFLCWKAFNPLTKMIDSRHVEEFHLVVLCNNNHKKSHKYDTKLFPLRADINTVSSMIVEIWFAFFQMVILTCFTGPETFLFHHDQQTEDCCWQWARLNTQSDSCGSGRGRRVRQFVGDISPMKITAMCKSYYHSQFRACFRFIKEQFSVGLLSAGSLCKRAIASVSVLCCPHRDRLWDIFTSDRFIFIHCYYSWAFLCSNILTNMHEPVYLLFLFKRSYTPYWNDITLTQYSVEALH